MAIKVYSGKSGASITWEREDGSHWSWHSNAKSNDEALFSVKTVNDGQYVRTYDEDNRIQSEELKDPK